MTIFHVLKYPIPDWDKDTLGNLLHDLPEDLRTTMNIELIEVIKKWANEVQSTYSLTELFNATYIRMLMEYEG